MELTLEQYKQTLEKNRDILPDFFSDIDGKLLEKYYNIHKGNFDKMIVWGILIDCYKRDNK